MQAKKLIEILSKLPPNTDVVLWNGYVGDYMPIKEAEVCGLYKLRPEAWAGLVNLQAELFDEPPSEKIDPHTARQHPKYKNVGWEFCNDGMKRGSYYARKVLMLQAGTRGKTAYSRSENVHY